MKTNFSLFGFHQQQMHNNNVLSLQIYLNVVFIILKIFLYHTECVFLQYFACRQDSNPRFCKFGQD